MVKNNGASDGDWSRMMRSRIYANTIAGLVLGWHMLGCAPVITPKNSRPGEELYHAGRYAEAIAQLSGFVSTHPQDAQGYYMLADALYQQYVGDHQSGLAQTENLHLSLHYFSRALEIDPSHAEAYSQRGVVRLALGDASGSKRDYEMALRIDPRLSRAYFNRAYWFEARQRYQEAIADYEKFMTLSDNETWRLETQKKIQALRMQLQGRPQAQQLLDEIIL